MQFIYFLSLSGGRTTDDEWSESEKQAGSDHFEYLTKALEQGKLILAGRSLELKPTGIVILELDSEEDAIDFMQNDPAIKSGLMEGRLAEYRVALSRS